MIREARLTDMDAIMQVFSAAKGIMRQSGNMYQWGEGYPLQRIVKQILPLSVFANPTNTYIKNLQEKLHVIIYQGAHLQCLQGHLH